MLGRQTTSDTAQRILDFASREFAARGYRGAALQRIADKAGVSKANIFHHFKSKDALYRAVIADACSDFLSGIQKASAISADFGERLRHLAHEHMHQILNRDATTQLILKEIYAGIEGGSQLQVVEVFRESYDAMLAMFEDARAAGVLRADLDPRHLAVMLVATNVFFFQARSVIGELAGLRFVTDPEMFVHGCVDILLRGALAETEAPQGL